VWTTYGGVYCGESESAPARHHLVSSSSLDDLVLPLGLLAAQNQSEAHKLTAKKNRHM
jgi:hypothetical protein